MARASKAARWLASVLVLASGLCGPAGRAGSGETIPVAPADVEPGRDVRGRAVVPADLPAPVETRGEVRRLRVLALPPGGPLPSLGPVEIEIELPGPEPVADDAH